MERGVTHSTESISQPGPSGGPEARSRAGGSIPGFGADGVAAFRLVAPSPSCIPVLIAVPHAGRAYPPGVLAGMRHPGLAPARLEDRLVDRVGALVAGQTGAALLVADAPRAVIDLNRAPQDIDWGMIAGAQGLNGGQNAGPNGGGGSAGRARAGLGLIPRRLPGVGELWKAPMAKSELIARIEGIHQPYHACLAETLAGLRARWGAALLIDLHSMPPLTAPLPSGRSGQAGRAGPARVVLGDRLGASCAGSLVASAFATLAEARMPAAHNRPYAGGYGVERHGAPGRGVHALQVEIDRSCYLDSRLLEPGDGLEAMVAVLVDMVRRLAGEVALLGAGAGDGAGGWSQAAE